RIADDAFPHYNLGVALKDKGQLDDAIAEFREVIRIKPGDREADNQLAILLRWKAALDKLPGILKGEAAPADAADRMSLAAVCRLPFKALYATSARFYAEAFAEKAQLGEELDLGYRYNAACAAALAGCGKGEDADRVGAKEGMWLRQQALDWLRTDLDAWD